MDGAGGDLQTKYHKIAGEYSKVRAQLLVLKKAIVEEQSHNVELKEALREKEQNLRKADQEADSLTFRNEQLTRRVTVLQDELDTLQNQTKNKKGKGKVVEGQQNSDFTNHVIDEEFRKKIAENAQLLSMMHEKEESHSQEVNHLTSQIHKLQQELDQLQTSSSNTAESYKNIISQLKEELHNVKGGQEQWGQMSQELSQLRRTHSEYELSTQTKLNSLNKIIKDHLPFIDSCNEVFNTLNVNCAVDNKQLELSSNVLDNLRSALELLCTTLSNWHSHSELRLHSLPLHNSTVNVKYSKHLREMNELAAELSSCFCLPSAEEYDESYAKSMIQHISEKLASYCSHAETLLIHQRLSVEEEDAEFAKDILKQSNKELLEKSSQFVSCIVQLSSCITLTTRNKTVQQAVESFQWIKQDLIMVFVSMQEAIKDLFIVYVSKSSIENEENLGTQELKQANVEVTNCLSMLLDSSSKVVQYLQELSKTADSSLVAHSVVSDLKRRASHYINSLQMDEAPSVSYLDALKDHEDAKNGAEMYEVLLQQLAECREQFVKSEQDREHWKEEYELLKLKYSQDGKASGITYSEKDKLSENTETSMLGAIVSPINLKEETEIREQELKKYFQYRICQLIIEAHEAQSKSATYVSENHALLRRLEISIESLVKSEQALLEARENITQLQEEVSITSSNYEAQLSTMSDHLANMNERLAQQKDIIDNLEYQISNKNNKKIKK